MKIREFDIENYNVDQIFKEMVRSEFIEYANKFKSLLTDELNTEDMYNTRLYSVKIKYINASKQQQKLILAKAKKAYEEKKAKSIQNYKDIRKKCDAVFYDDKAYEKLIPELDRLYYCQAYSALSDFMDKKNRSKAVSNARFQARLMSYSKVACD